MGADGVPWGLDAPGLAGGSFPLRFPLPFFCLSFCSRSLRSLAVFLPHALPRPLLFASLRPFRPCCAAICRHGRPLLHGCRWLRFFLLFSSSFFPSVLPAVCLFHLPPFCPCVCSLLRFDVNSCVGASVVPSLLSSLVYASSASLWVRVCEVLDEMCACCSMKCPCDAVCFTLGFLPCVGSTSCMKMRLCGLSCCMLQHESYMVFCVPD